MYVMYVSVTLLISSLLKKIRSCTNHKFGSDSESLIDMIRHSLFDNTPAYHIIHCTQQQKRGGGEREKNEC